MLMLIKRYTLPIFNFCNILLYAFIVKLLAASGFNLSGNTVFVHSGKVLLYRSWNKKSAIISTT